MAWLFRRASVPGFVIALRLFCVLLASFVVPLGARLARLLLPQRGVFFALPLVALLPNTLFFVDRVTNDALAWPILAAIAASLVLVARRPGNPRRAFVLGLLVAAGVWTKLTLLPALPAALAAALWARRRKDGRRPSLLLAAVGLPALLVAPLLLWNRLASGSWTGINYLGRAPQTRLARRACAPPRTSISAARCRSGRAPTSGRGAGDLSSLPARTYGIVLGAIVLGAAAALAAARLRQAPFPGGSRWAALAALAFLFFAAMLSHLLSAAAAAGCSAPGRSPGAKAGTSISCGRSRPVPPRPCSLRQRPRG